MELLHNELRRAREKAGLTQQALAHRAGIPRNQIVRAERGENITVDTLRKIAVHLPVTELTLLETTSFRVDIFAEPEKLFMSAVENVLRQANALRGAIQLAMDARTAVEAARRVIPPPPEAYQPSPDFNPVLLRNLDRLAGEIETLEKETKFAS
jgi:transcriptional regulator with XRE-family HTH domain